MGQREEAEGGSEDCWGLGALEDILEDESPGRAELASVVASVLEGGLLSDAAAGLEAEGLEPREVAAAGSEDLGRSEVAAGSGPLPASEVALPPSEVATGTEPLPAPEEAAAGSEALPEPEGAATGSDFAAVESASEPEKATESEALPAPEDSGIGFEGFPGLDDTGI